MDPTHSLVFIYSAIRFRPNGSHSSGLNPTNKKFQIQIFFLKNLKILEASSYVQTNMTKFWLEHDQKFLQRRTNRQSRNKKNL